MRLKRRYKRDKYKEMIKKYNQGKDYSQLIIIRNIKAENGGVELFFDFFDHNRINYFKGYKYQTKEGKKIIIYPIRTPDKYETDKLGIVGISLNEVDYYSKEVTVYELKEGLEYYVILYANKEILNMSLSEKEEFLREEELTEEELKEIWEEFSTSLFDNEVIESFISDIKEEIRGSEIEEAEVIES